ncbi:MAG: hypothetical protein AAF371_17645 [Pseudomonadota bacterium]
MQISGIDIHRAFAEAVMLDEGAFGCLGRIGVARNDLEAVAATLDPTDQVIVEGPAMPWRCSGSCALTWGGSS